MAHAHTQHAVRLRFTENLCAAENDNDDKNVWAKWERMIIWLAHSFE